MSGHPDAPRSEYPAPIPVLTSTIIGYDALNPKRIVLVELAKPEVPGKSLVLPGGIFDAGRGRHLSQRTVAVDELLEETGLRVADNARPVHIAISQRLDIDPRRWCSFPTINGANDYILAAPLLGTINPRDTQEVRRAVWMNVHQIDMTTVGRGHDLVLALWAKILDCGGLSLELFSADNRVAIEALSNERHIVSVGEITNIIYLEDRSPIQDRRS